MICPVCQRERKEEPGECCKDTHRVVICFVSHQYYGCDTGCCGHALTGLGEDDSQEFYHFDFDHPYGVTSKEFIETLAGSYLPGVPIDWDRCDVRDVC